MSYLFHIEDRVKVMPKPEILLIEPFKTIWNRDKSSKKERALAELAYIELFTSQKKSNPYKNYPPDQRKDLLKKSIIKSQKWKEDSLIKEAIEKLDKFQYDSSPTYSYYLSNLAAAEEIKAFLRSFDLKERNPKTGLPLYKPKDITSAIRDTDSTIETLKKLEDKVHAELEEATSVRGNKMITYFNNPKNFS